jgi:hypothetical protein
VKEAVCDVWRVDRAEIRIPAEWFKGNLLPAGGLTITGLEPAVAEQVTALLNDGLKYRAERDAVAKRREP